MNKKIEKKEEELPTNPKRRSYFSNQTPHTAIGARLETNLIR